MYYTSQLELILQSMQDEKQRNAMLLSQLPKDNLYYQKVSGKKTFLIESAASVSAGKTASGKKLVSIARQPELIAKLLKKEFLQGSNALLDNNIDKLSRLIPGIKKLDSKSVADYLPKRCQSIPEEKFTEVISHDFVLPNPISDDGIHAELLSTKFNGISAEEWGAAPYLENTTHPENKRHRGADGLFFRSKAEMLIAGIYEKNKIPFHYDEVFTDGLSLISPDFVFISSGGDMIYHEHLGMTTNDDYIKSNLRKFQMYADSGIVPGINLILTADYPDGSIDLKLIEDTINLYRNRRSIGGQKYQC